ncbi:MAG: glycosyltransferase family 4 protein [Proteobacteria bacterium]|nr:glycosyltransferase family 4 protein [Pseudomonadota bacterium]
MNIAIIRQRYNPYGGGERFVSRAVRALGREGIDVTVFARDWNDGAVEGEAIEFVRCDPFYAGRTWRDWSFGRAVCAALTKRKFDLVQSHERIACCDVYRAGDGVHAQWLANRARVLGLAGRIGMALNPYHRFLLAAERRLFASARLRAVICNSRMVRDEIRRHFSVPEEKLHIVYNGVDLEYFHPSLKSARSSVRSGLGIAPDAMVYLFVGSGFERKGLPQLLRATHLIVVGEDKRQGKLRQLSAQLGILQRVHFVGAQNDVRPWYGGADCFVLPTLYDPFPNAALEAMASGLPVITTGQCGAAEFIENGVCGAVYEAGDGAALEAALGAIGSVEQAETMGLAARAAVSGLGIEATAMQLAGLYRSLLNTGERRAV